MKRAIQASMLAFGVYVAGCQSPDGSVGSAAQALSAPELAASLDGGPQRLEIKLDATLHASEVQVENAGHEEHVEARVVGLDPAGSIALDLGGLSVAFDAATRLRALDGSDAVPATWQSAVTSALAAGTPIFVRASRPLPAAPNAPSDGTFVATDLRLESAIDGAKLELFVDGDNFTLNAGGGTFHILGHEVQVSAETELWSDDIDGEGSDDAADDHGGGAGGSHGGGADDPPGSETPG